VKNMVGRMGWDRLHLARVGAMLHHQCRCQDCVLRDVRCDVLFTCSLRNAARRSSLHWHGGPRPGEAGWGVLTTDRRALKRTMKRTQATTRLVLILHDLHPFQHPLDPCSTTFLGRIPSSLVFQLDSRPISRILTVTAPTPIRIPTRTGGGSGARIESRALGRPLRRLGRYRRDGGGRHPSCASAVGR
jgi:hypothetical protein